MLIFLVLFNKKYKFKVKLIVGVRVLLKYCYRDVICEWWGICVGIEEVKNEYVNFVFMRIFEDVLWINIYLLLYDFKVIEVRYVDGYGVRWSYDGIDFRGFLEF